MARNVIVAASGRRCGRVPASAATPETDAAVVSYLNQVVQNVIPRNPDLILLPEMCDLPENWDMDAYFCYLDARMNTVQEFIQGLAKKHRVWIAYCTVRKTASGRYRNSCLMIDRSGNLFAVFDKLHPTLGELEHGVEPGDGLTCVSCELGRIGCMICFDANDLAAAVGVAEQKLDLLLFPALFHGGLLQQVWALSSGAHFIAACGGCGASVVSPLGQILSKSPDRTSETVLPVNCDCETVHLDFNGEKIRAATEKYGCELTVSDPNNIGAVLLTSQSECRTVQQILREFEIEPRDQYLQRVFQLARNIVEERHER